jgi:glycosyltransferase involved in cell wall biosynthesis
MHRICLAIPVYNENKSLEKTIVELSVGSSDYKLLFIDDGSTDGSSDTLNSFKGKYEFEVLGHQINLGYGAACRTGATWAFANGFEWIIFADSDLTNPPIEIINLSKRLLSSNFNIHKANRMPSESLVVVGTKYRHILSTFAKYFTNFFVGHDIQDPTNGFRAIRLDLYQQFRLTANDFSLIMEEVYEYIRLDAQVCNFDSCLGVRDEDQRLSSFRYSKKLVTRYIYWSIRCMIQRISGKLRLFKAKTF